MSLAKQARALNRACRRPSLPALILITDQARLGDPVPLIARLPRGSAVIMRDYDQPDRARRAQSLARACRRHRVCLLIAGDPRLACAVRADGIHLPEWRLRDGRPRMRRRPWLVTAAAHDRAGLWRAARAGADAALLSPVFPTLSHPGARSIGIIRFTLLARSAPLPVYALGGVDGRTARRLKGSGACGLAAIGGFNSREVDAI